MKQNHLVEGGRGYKLLGDLGTEPNVIYLKKVDLHAKAEVEAHA